MLFCNEKSYSTLVKKWCIINRVNMKNGYEHYGRNDKFTITTIKDKTKWNETSVSSGDLCNCSSYAYSIKTPRNAFRYPCNTRSSYQKQRMSFSKVKNSSLILTHEQIWTGSAFFTQVFIQKFYNCLWRNISYNQKHVVDSLTEFSSSIAGDINLRRWLLDLVAQLAVEVHGFWKLFRIPSLWNVLIIHKTESCCL